MADNNKTTGGMGLGTLLFLIFLVMKLAGIGSVANWSWWWVTSPLWIPVTIVVGLGLIVLIITVIKN
tara:strand:- start:1184 stop:1384 length:201 start_codon:yes stop_codon:yes gene_type:complete